MMNKLQDSIQTHSFNRDVVFQTVQNKIQNNTHRHLKQKKFWIASGVVAAMLISLFWGWRVNAPIQNGFVDSTIPTQLASTAEKPAYRSLAYALVSVDTNSNFSVYTDNAGNVIGIEEKRDDEARLDTSALINMPIQEAVAEIISLANEADYINLTGAVPDYVVISTASLDANDKNLDRFRNLIDDAIISRLSEQNDLDGSHGVVILKSSLEMKLEADEKDIPLGLHMINSLIGSVDGKDLLDLSEFVSDPENIKRLEKYGVILWIRQESQDDDPFASTRDEAAETNDDDENSGTDDRSEEVGEESDHTESTADDEADEDQDITEATEDDDHEESGTTEATEDDDVESQDSSESSERDD